MNAYEKLFSNKFIFKDHSNQHKNKMHFVIQTFIKKKKFNFGLSWAIEMDVQKAILHKVATPPNKSMIFWSLPQFPWIYFLI